ncbi:MAG TPA: MATE family efflux transporter [Candidatus Limnocylindria bacterium]|nr:MATE family efflux transporter [Candidatus Limnocylindria bacterium]
MTLDTEELPAEPITAEPELLPAPTARVAYLAAMSPARAALELAWPGIVEQLVRAASQAAVIAFIGHLGAVQLAAAGAALQFTFLLFPVFMALSIGTVALVSRRLGEGRPEDAADVVRQSLMLGALLGIATGLAFAVFARPLLLALGAAPDVADAGAPYLAIVGGLNAFQTVWTIGTAALRAAGDTRTPMLLSIGSAALAVPLAYVAVVVLDGGLVGAGLAFVPVNVLFCAITIAILWRGRAGLSVAGGPWRLRPAVVRQIADISVPSAAESFLFSLGLMALAGVVLRFGTEAFAAHQLVLQLESLSFLPCVGFAAAASALVGQSLGLRDPARATRVGWAAVRMGALWTSAVGLVLALFPAASLGLFTSDPGVVAAGIGSTVIIGLAQPAQAVIFTLGGALRGAGDTRYTLKVTTLNWVVVRLPLAVLLSMPFGLGLAGVWLAIAADYHVRGALFARRFASGAWQRLRV